MARTKAIEELKRCSELCPTTPLAEACRMAVEAIAAVKKREVHDCYNCRHEDRMPNVYPCSECQGAYREPPSKWEPKEVDNGTD